MTEQRKTASPPMVENIPPELLDLIQWVVWRYEMRDDKWTKVPYTPYAMRSGKPCKAMPNKPATWRSFQVAYGCYLERSDYFDGIGFMFLKGGPYVGGDRDHCIVDGAVDPDALALIPHTYAEISPSGSGLKFIARACGTYGRHTKKGELYSWGRFFTITGNVLAGYTTITECQAAVDTFHTSLGKTEHTVKEGKPGHGSRAANAAAIPDEEWAEGRRLLREEINRLVAQLRASARPKKEGKAPQLYYVLSGDLRGLQDRYPRANVIREDNSIDSSQVRAIFANGMRMRGFTFPQFVALFYHFYGAECLAKWGTTQAFREEAATLWAIGRTPRVGEATPPVVEPAPRGRAGSREELLERAYQVLLNYRAGASAIVMLKDVARDLGVHKDTALRAIKDLTGTRITTRRHGQYGGLVVDFLPELIIETTDVHSNGQEGENESADAQDRTELIHENDEPHHNHSNTDAMSATEKTAELIYGGGESGRTAVHNSMDVLTDERGGDPPLYRENIYKCNPVYLQGTEINSEKRIRNRVDIRAAVTEALDNLERKRVLDTGEIKTWLITKKRVVAYVQEHYGGEQKAIERCYDAIREWRRNETFRRLEKSKRSVVERQHAAVSRTIERMEEKAVTHELPEVRVWYANEAARRKGQLGLFGWELSRRDGADEQRIDQEGYSQAEQQEMLDLVERERRDTAGQYDSTGLADRIRKVVKRE